VDPSKVIQRPPFANYDLVVYFGGGLFAIPFINRYLVVPTQIRWPQFKVIMASDVASEIVAGLALLFSIYIMGHIIAYVASQLIERAMSSVLGKVSSAIIISSSSPERIRNDAMRALIFYRLKLIWKAGFRIAHLVRFVFHLPVIPLYLVSFLFGVFGYYETRIPAQIVNMARQKMARLDWDGLRISLRTKWFKPLEYYVINFDQAATLRMYNYLVIGGLFRSLSLVLLSALWLQIYYSVHLWVDGDVFLSPLFARDPFLSLLVELGITAAVYLFCLFSFIKFQRRYAEEAIFTFALKDFENGADRR